MFHLIIFTFVIDFKIMATFNFSELNPEIREMKTYSDSETGCTSYDDQAAFEACRQSYFLKQQSEQKNAEQKDIKLIESQIETLQQEIKSQQKEIRILKAQQDVQAPQKDNTFLQTSQSALVLYLLIILIVAFTAGILFAKKIINK